MALHLYEDEGLRIAKELEKVYDEAYNASAGPEDLRHSVNFRSYHLAGLLGVYEYLKEKEKHG
jgi:hypothetical protein